MVNIKSGTPKIDAAYEMLRTKNDWDFDGLIGTVNLTLECKAGNIICDLMVPQEPGVDNACRGYTTEEYHLIECAMTELLEILSPHHHIPSQ